MYRLHHIPKCIEPFFGTVSFDTIEAAQQYLDNHHIFFLKEQDVYITYEKIALQSIEIAVKDFISNSEGYHVQPCEFEILEVK